MMAFVNVRPGYWVARIVLSGKPSKSSVIAAAFAVAVRARSAAKQRTPWKRYDVRRPKVIRLTVQ